MSVALKVEAEMTKPCHNDTTPSNFLLGPDNRVQIVDFENTGNNDPAWDLAYTSVETVMTDQKEAELVESYSKNLKVVSFNLHARLTLYKLVVMHWIALWTKLQSVESNPAQEKSVFENKSRESLMSASVFAKTPIFKEAWHLVCEPDCAEPLELLLSNLN